LPGDSPFEHAARQLEKEAAAGDQVSQRSWS
jgi:hypothetical protein